MQYIRQAHILRDDGENSAKGRIQIEGVREQSAEENI
jgi:hypothetical protein